SHSLTQLFVGYELLETFRHLFQRPRRVDDKAVVTLAHQLASAVLPRGDHGQAGTHRFQHDETARVVERGEGKYVGAGKALAGVGEEAEKADLGFNTQLPWTARVGLVAPTAASQQLYFRMPPSHRGECGKQGIEALEFIIASHKQDGNVRRRESTAA